MSICECSWSKLIKDDVEHANSLVEKKNVNCWGRTTGSIGEHEIFHSDSDAIKGRGDSASHDLIGLPNLLTMEPPTMMFMY